MLVNLLFCVAFFWASLRENPNERCIMKRWIVLPLIAGLAGLPYAHGDGK
jgi:hypothetical protein